MTRFRMVYDVVAGQSGNAVLVDMVRLVDEIGGSVNYIASSSRSVDFPIILDFEMSSNEPRVTIPKTDKYHLVGENLKILPMD